ncbi:MAG: methyl-accepting chemotaxis protein [Granulosicoccus sp.]|jgi:methyl-accepting chemotaxis protein
MNVLNQMSVKLKIAILSAFFILFSCFTAFSVISTVNQQSLDGQVINIAGRQRMLLQKMAKEYFVHYVQPDIGINLDETKRLFVLSLDALMNGGETFTDLQMTQPLQLPATSHNDAIESLLLVENLWAQYEKQLDAFVSSKESSADKYVHLNQKTDELVDKMNTSVAVLANKAQEKINALKNQVMLLLLLSVVLGSVLTVLIVRLVTGPLDILRQFSKDIREGKLDGKLPQGFSAGNSEVASLARSIDEMRNSLELFFGTMKSNSLHMKNTAQQVSRISKTIISASDQQDDKAQLVQLSIEELMTISSVVKDYIEQASASVNNSQIKASEGIASARKNIGDLESAVDGVSAASDMMTNLSESAEKMHAIVDSIQNIAAQTNLLALNAAIEAARAGEQGRGFAVVADEVRTLAARTSTSTGEITELIDTFSSKVADSVGSMSSLVDQVNTIQKGSQETIDNFEEMNQDVVLTAANNEQVLQQNQLQTARIDELSAEIVDLFSVLKNNASSADSTTLVSEDLYNTAETIRKKLDGYTVRNLSRHSEVKGNEQRSKPRVRSNVVAKIFYGGEKLMNTMVEDVSLSGCRLVTKDSLPSVISGKRMLRLELQMPQDDANDNALQAPLSVKAEVVRSEDRKEGSSGQVRYIYGLEFSSLDDDKKQKLKKVIGHFSPVPH